MGAIARVCIRHATGRLFEQANRCVDGHGDDDDDVLIRERG